MILTLLGIALVALLAAANGANDNCKGVATLVGFGDASPRGAMAWATLTTAAGAGFSFWFAGGLIAAFKARMFLPGTLLDAAFFTAALIGAIGWVAVATRWGLPVSSTHAIVGGLLGAGLVSVGSGQILWSFLGSAVAIPLLLGPVISLVIVYVLAWPVTALTRSTTDHCVCSAPAIGINASGEATAAGCMLVTDSQAQCGAAGAQVLASGSSVTRILHGAAGGLVGFARGWNDAPKITALGIVALEAAGAPHPAAAGFLIVTCSMAIGGMLAGGRVLDTMARKLTPLPLPESLTASMATAALVAAASWLSMPVSTTHVSTGAIVGAGLKNDPKSVRWGKVREIAVSWVVTIPVAGVLAAACMVVVQRTRT